MPVYCPRCTKRHFVRDTSRNELRECGIELWTKIDKIMCPCGCTFRVVVTLSVIAEEN
jgi:hypothetical protein